MYIRKRKQRCTSRCCLAEAGERKNRNQDSPPKEVGVFSTEIKMRKLKKHETFACDDRSGAKTFEHTKKEIPIGYLLFFTSY